MLHDLFVHSSADRLLGDVHSAVWYLCTRFCADMSTPRSGGAGGYGNSGFNCLRSLQTVSRAARDTSHSQRQWMSFHGHTTACLFNYTFAWNQRNACLPFFCFMMAKWEGKRVIVATGL